MKNIKKCFKSYLEGKKYLDSDINKAYNYFQDCIYIINNIKDKVVENNLNDIINKTEIECDKYLKILLDKNNISNVINIDLFNIIETGNINELNNYKYGQINFRIYDHNGLSPLHYAIIYGDSNFIMKAFELGAKIDETTLSGYTLIEYACLEKDPNMIIFLLNYGANMKKHIEFRKSKNYINRSSEIDIILLKLYILEHEIPNNYSINYLEWIYSFINIDTILEIERSNDIKQILFNELIIKLDYILNNFKIECRQTYINIIKEELNYTLLQKIYCPKNKIEIILYNLIPFIDYIFNLNLFWLINLEIKYLYLKNKILLSNNTIKSNIQETLKNELIEKYIKTQIFSINFLNSFFNLKI
uniref:Uncharacterized protein n=1 Tax=viral metagenome TaxID=1070528 RepID=A0A6C0H7V3_9ZZZZ